MGDSNSIAIRPSFNGSLRIEGRGACLTSYAGFPLLREVDERLGITASVAARLKDPRDSSRTHHGMSELLRTWIYSTAACRATATAANELRFDPALRIAVSNRRGLAPLNDKEETLASQPTLSRLLGTLSSEENLAVLEDGLFDSAVRAVRGIHGKKLDVVTLDIDSFPHEVHGGQAGADYNGHYRKRCYHPLGVMLGETGHWLGLKLRPGPVHTADGAEDMLLPLIEKASEEIAVVVDVRGDAGFFGPELLDKLDDGHVRFAFRLPKNSDLRRLAEEYEVRPVGRPPAKPRTWCHEVQYRALTWQEKRRVILVVQEKPGELFLHSFFIVTSFKKEELNADAVLGYYRERGTMEGHIGEHQSVIDGYLSSTNRPKRHIKGKQPVQRSVPIDPERANAAALCLHGLAFNLLNTARILAGMSVTITDAPGLHLRRARQLLLATAGRMVVSARRATLVVSEQTAAIWARLWKALLRMSPQPVVS